MEQHKIALITGGGRGIGKNIALRLAEKGTDIIITYNSNRAAAEETAAQIKFHGQKVHVIQLDVEAISGFGSFISQLQTSLPIVFGTDKIDFLINNGGFGIDSPSFADTTEEQFDRLMNVHFKGVFFLTQQILPLLRDGGGIVNISTALTRISFIGRGAYASIKSAVETLTIYLAKELGSRNIRVNVVAPGAIATDFGGGRTRDNVQIQDYLKSITALPRIGQADDIGPVVAFLCSEEAKWITAQRIEASGGILL